MEYEGNANEPKSSKAADGIIDFEVFPNAPTLWVKYEGQN